MPGDVVRALGTHASQIKYLGLGRDIAAGQAGFGVFARGVSGTAGFTHELHFYFVSAPDSERLRQTLGHLSLCVRANGEVIPSAHSFNQEHQVRPIPVETLVAPLGEWAVAKAAEVTLADIEARSREVLNPAIPTELPVEALDPMIAFLADPDNREAYFRFNYGTDRLANGIVVAQVPLPEA